MMIQNIDTKAKNANPVSSFSSELVAKIKALANASHSAEVAMVYLACRDRLRDFTDLHRTRNQLVHDGEKIVEEDFLALFKGLQELDLGHVVYEKKGKNKDRKEAVKFEWHVSFKKVAQAALNGVQTRSEPMIDAPIPTIKAKPVIKRSRVRRNSNKLDMAARAAAVRSQPLPAKEKRLLFIALRKDFSLEIALPGNLSSEEAELINTAVKRLIA